MPALQSGCYELTWEKCADLPSAMYDASAVLHNEKVHVMAGIAPDGDTVCRVFSYDILSNHWDTLPPSGHSTGVLQIIDGKLSVIGGWDTNTEEVTNKVSTLINNRWTQHYPNMTKGRIRPGVATHSDYVIVAGGIRDMNTSYDDIELLYYKHPPHWITTNINLPVPMNFISLTISDDLLYIAGYDISDNARSNEAYQVAVDKITSSVAQPPTSSQTVQWTTIPSTPHYNTAIIPNSSPPVIIGGDDLQCVPTAVVAMLKQSWSKVASLPSPRRSVAVVPIGCQSILVIGGSIGGKTDEEIPHSVTTVEKGTVKRSHTVPAIPTQDTQCIIQ